MNLNRDSILNLFRDILAGKVKKQQLIPPKMKYGIRRDGSFFYEVDGEPVDNETFFKVRDYYNIDPFEPGFYISFSSPDNEDL